MKQEIRELGLREDGTPRFPERKIDKIEVDYPDEERRVHADLAAYTESRRRESSTKRGVAAADLITLLLKKRLFSSSAAFSRTLDAHIRTITEAGHAVGDPDSLRDAYERVEIDFEDDEELKEATIDALRAAARASAVVMPAQQALLTRMQTWAHAAKDRSDEKARGLIAQLKAWCRPIGAKGKPTLASDSLTTATIWLHEPRLPHDGILPSSLITKSHSALDHIKMCTSAAFHLFKLWTV